MHYLPFETLASGSGRFLVEDHPIMYAPSVSVLASLSRTGADGASRRELLAYGDPRFTAGQARGRPVQALYRSAGYRFVRLPATRQEVLGIGSYFPAPMRTLLLGEAATEQSVKEADLRAYRRLHFATHAVLDERVPARSGIVLSQIGTGREDGILHASEVMELKLDAELVVLSACRTGLGQLVGGEGMVGLTRSFFHAGAQRVVVSLWDVNDQSTARLMKEFYRQMSAGHGPADALRAAKLSFLRSNAPLERQPHFWAGFVLSGAE
ncbi:MAG: CHAT domain-containing protein [Bryobacterales bacterium]|nr:CHAT domain-containing protein [Bryobacterales bacterium]